MPNSAKNASSKPALKGDSALQARPSSSSKSAETPSVSWLELSLKQAMTRAMSGEPDSLMRISSSKWPLIVDKDERAQAFFLNRDVNLLNCMDPESMKPERVRIAIIGAIRYGRTLVLDFMAMDGPLLESFQNTCNMLNKDLFGHLVQRTLVDEEKNFLYLAKPEQDGKDYESIYFTPVVTSGFRVIYLTSNETPSEKILKISVPIRIV